MYYYTDLTDKFPLVSASVTNYDSMPQRITEKCDNLLTGNTVYLVIKMCYIKKHHNTLYTAQRIFVINLGETGPIQRIFLKAFNFKISK